MSDEDQKRRLNLGYPLGQLARALAGAGEQAATRAKRWQQVLSGMLTGALNIGSRTPLPAMPAWVTLEVLQGGFATGNLAAGGRLLEHETARLEGLARPEGTTDRAALNLYFASDPGRAELAEWLRTGRYRVHVPEEAALLTMAWLLAHDQSERAGRLVETIGPFFDRLRFYPVPHPRPRRADGSVNLATVAEAVEHVRTQRAQPAVARMKEAIQVWAPLYDQVVALFLETVEGDIPRLQTTESGALARQPNGGPIVEGGWPCRRFPADWKVRVAGVLESYRRAREDHGLCTKPERRKENFARLRDYAARCLRDRGSLARGDHAAIRQILAAYVTRRGGPGSDRLQRVRAEQTRNAALPDHRTLARVLADRLERLPADEGAPGLRDELGGLSAEEAASARAPAGTPIPPHLVAKAMRCLEAPIETLVAERVISSSEVMAALLPAVTAAVRAGAIAAPELRLLYQSVYTAFRRRRSLLLLDLQSQARLAELPWVEAIAPWIGDDDQTRQAALNTLTRAAALALRSFPHTILPNKLVKELRALAAGAGVRIPLVDELAADIFMGEFSEVFLQAAQEAARLLEGTLYQRYFGLPFARLLGFGVQAHSSGASVSPQLASLCEELAGDSSEEKSSVARNGKIIEQSQILTTHNLAALFRALDLQGQLRAELPQMARRCFQWICARQRRLAGDWRAQLQATKNTAYAWRQMIFFVSLLDADDRTSFFAWMSKHFAAQPDTLRDRFWPAVAGLKTVAAGDRFDAAGMHEASGGRRFLGWAEGRHWLLASGGVPAR